LSAERHERLKRIFWDASELPVEERAEYLDRACVDDSSVRLEVEEMLAFEEQQPDFLEGATDEAESSPTSARVLERLQTRIGEQSRYQILGEFARGGMGAILKVWDSDLRRTLAMKVVLGKAHAERSGDTPAVDEKSLGRFLEEAQVTGQLDHPGIVPVHELGIDTDGQVYFTMRLVKGIELRKVFELVREGKDGWTHARAVGTILKVCEAMAYAHSKDVIHRDLKPANIMVGKYGEVYVMDWGLARPKDAEDNKDLRLRPAPQTSLSVVRTDRREESGGESPLMTMDGDVVGTPAYMSPEQARGDQAAMGPASDVYALGTILYHLLAGHMPYGPPGSRLTAYALWGLVQNGPPTKLDTIAKDAPVELIAICEKAMEREIADRYPDMGAMAEDLSAYVEGRVVKAHRTGALIELRKWVGRNRALAASLAAALVIALGGLSGVGYVQAEGKKESDAERANVMRLSAFQELEDLKREADELWPPRLEHEQAYEDWLKRARALVAGLDPLPDGTDAGHRARLAELERRALPNTADRTEEGRRAHPRYAELDALERKIAALEKAQAVRAGAAQVEELALEEDALPRGPRVREHIWPLIDPGRVSFGREAEGLALARLAVERVQNDGEAADFTRILAWAEFANGLDEEAQSDMGFALSVAPPEMRPMLALEQLKLERAIRAAEGGAIADLRGGVPAFRDPDVPSPTDQLAELEALVQGAPAEWRFADQTDRWWHAQLSQLVNDIAAFADEQQGLIDGVSAEHGWGVARRLEWAREIEALTVTGPEAARLWSDALASIRDPDECPAYAGLEIEPQLGLLPLGRDPHSGLWEFAQPLSGRTPERNGQGELELQDDAGIVFVLIPGGAFTMGAQAADPAAPNYDQKAHRRNPLNQVLLTPYFLSKYEMTQGQWLRYAGHNPSYDQNVSGVGPEPPLHPVNQMTWPQAAEAMWRMGLVLPSEAQWERGARGGTSTTWWTGNERDSLVGAVNLADRAAGISDNWPAIAHWPELYDGYESSAPVNTLAANPFGLHHVLGNVSEWCRDGDADSEDFYAVGPVVDPVVPDGSGRNRAVRGSSYYMTADLARSAVRSGQSVVYASWDLGLRPARAVLGEIR
jgi:serine/threonine protein kinase/formylglycine-generating enzyme required for sulfatase activity